MQGGAHGIVGYWRTRGGRTAVHCGMLENPGDGGGPQCVVGCWRIQGMGGPQCIVKWWRIWSGLQCIVGCWRTQVRGPHGTVGCWRTQSGRTPVHCGILGDANALWDAGEPGVGGPQSIVGCQGMGVLWDVGGSQCIVGCWRTQMGIPYHHGILEGAWGIMGCWRTQVGIMGCLCPPPGPGGPPL